VCILTGWLVWINGPYKPRIWNNLSIFCNALLLEFDDGERVEADNGYRGESLKYVKCPKSIGKHKALETAVAIVWHQQETTNRRYKQWGILKQVYRGNIVEHGQAFCLCAIVTQLAIKR
jgi:hypothetical protein